MTMNNPTYRCTLKPLNKFFFGGERTFGQEGAGKTNYLVRSNAFPQQTTVLGMLRFELLKQGGLLPIDAHNKEIATELIGNQSFKVDANEPNYGLITSISPLFISKGEESLMFAPRDVLRYVNKDGVLVTNEEWTVKIDTNDKAFLFGSQQKMALPTIDAFNHKAFYQAHFLTSDNTSVPFAYDADTKEGVFISESQIGIKIGSKKKDDKGFYKQFYYRMSQQYTFGFYLETSKPITLKSSIVYMGADKSAFMLTVNEVKDRSFESDFGLITKQSGTKITLLSDTYLSEGVYQYCSFTVTDTIPFRNIETSLETADYHNLYRNKLTRCLHLLVRGSVLYPTDLKEVTRILNNENFKKIGYNIYKID